jgi:hypothetical protein
MIILISAIIAFLLFALFRDKGPRFNFLGNRSWARQGEFVFADGVVLILAMVVVYILIRVVKWAWVHFAI